MEFSVKLDVALLSMLFGVVYSVAVELYPPASKWWSQLSAPWKRAYRAYFGLAVIVVFVILHYTVGLDIGLTPPLLTGENLAALLTIWWGFLGGSEGAYQAFGAFYPRKK